MAFGRLETRKPDAPMSEINVTPMVDVMLVLLVIFILTAPLLHNLHLWGLGCLPVPTKLRTAA